MFAFVVPFENFRSATEGRALKILDCLSEASFQNLVRLTEQTGPKGERFVGAAFFGLTFLAVKKGNRGLGQSPVEGNIQ